MPDITMCTSKTCPSRGMCYRSADSGTIPDPWRQSVSDFKHIPLLGRCGNFKVSFTTTPSELYHRLMKFASAYLAEVQVELDQHNAKATETYALRQRIADKAAVDPSRVGTNIFKSKYAAIKYYSQYSPDCDDIAAVVHSKIQNFEIQINPSPSNSLSTGKWDEDDRWQVSHYQGQYDNFTEIGMKYSIENVVPYQQVHREIHDILRHTRLLRDLEDAAWVKSNMDLKESHLKSAEADVMDPVRVKAFHDKYYCVDGRPFYPAHVVDDSVVSCNIRSVWRYVNNGINFVVVTKEVEPPTKDIWGLTLKPRGFQYVNFRALNGYKPEVFTSRAALLRSLKDA